MGWCITEEAEAALAGAQEEVRLRGQQEVLLSPEAEAEGITEANERARHAGNVLAAEIVDDFERDVHLDVARDVKQRAGGPEGVVQGGELARLISR